MAPYSARFDCFWVQTSFMYGPLLTRSISLQSSESPRVPPPQATSDHIKEVHKKYSCNECGFRAATVMDVRKHIKATHIKMEKKKHVMADEPPVAPEDVPKYSEEDMRTAERIAVRSAFRDAIQYPLES